MNNHKLLSLNEAAKLRGVAPDDIRRYVMEDRTLPALLVDLHGDAKPFPFLGLRVYAVSESCAVTDYKGNPAGHLRFDMAAVIQHLAEWAHEGANFTPLSALKDLTDSDDVNKPWLVADSRDPDPLQGWYTPARYFARQLVVTDSTLLTKRQVLADKVSKSLAGVGIYKRGGVKPHSAGTVQKAFVNVRLS